MALLSDIIHQLELLAPPSLQESYDNAGLITGDTNMEIKGILVCLDSIEAVLDEAIAKKCNLVVAHHPIIFSGLKKITGKTYIERVIIKAIQNHIAIYAIHTNLDNVRSGVNNRICQQLKLKNTRILSPMTNQLKKLVTFVPTEASEQVKNALFEAGAGAIGNYSDCSFTLTGTGTFKAGKGASPFVGKIGERHGETEDRIEFIYKTSNESTILNALKKSHPYEEVAFDLYPLTNINKETGAGMIGELENEMETGDFLDYLKEKMKVNVIRHTFPVKKQVKTVAICGGSGSFLLKDAIRSKADIFISGDFKYHQFFDAEEKIIIADIGHFESEQFTIDLLGTYLREKFTTFAVHLTETNTNPIHYR